MGTIAPPSQDSAVRTIGRGLETAPILRQGLGVTWMFAAVGAVGRVVVPILIQQAIDRGIDGDGEVQIDLIVQMALIGAVAVIVSGCRLPAGVAAARRAQRAGAATTCARGLIGHIHQLSLADHNDERRGGLVARVTSDIETLAQFFQWGGLAWLLDGTLMVIVAGRDARLQLACWRWSRSPSSCRWRSCCERCSRASFVAYDARPPQQRRHARHDRRGRVGRPDDPCLRRRRDARAGRSRTSVETHDVGADQGGA